MFMYQMDKEWTMLLALTTNVAQTTWGRGNLK